MNSAPVNLARRKFLITTSACAVAASVLGPSLFASNRSQSVQRIAVGFARVGEKAALVPASSIPSSDGGFISRGARIAVSGSSGTSGDPRARRAVDLLVHFPYFDGPRIENAPFHAWGASRVTGGQGSPIRFRVPVDLIQKVDMTMVVESGDREVGSSTSRRRAIGGAVTNSKAYPVSFAVRDDDSAVKLVRGFYVLVPLLDSDPEPDWSSFHLFRRNGRWALVDRMGETAPFEHLVIRVDYATT